MRKLHCNWFWRQCTILVNQCNSSNIKKFFLAPHYYGVSLLRTQIKNEMIKSSLNELMPVYLKLFNTVLDLGTMPQMWCDGLITPIFKCGTKSDPSNYRGICISSCIGKLFCSILNQRLLKHVDLNNILHKSQIGFLANNRTADHVLTLGTRRKYMRVLLTLGKPLIRFGMMGFSISYLRSMSKESFIV